MKKIFLSTLALAVASALASPPPPPASVAEFDIEGFKLGMSEEATTALLKEKCEDGDFRSQEKKARGYDILHSKQYSCRIKDTNEYINLIVHDKVNIIVSEREIRYPDNLPKEDQKIFSENIYAKLLEKYGKPTHEVPKEKDISEIDFIGNEFPDVAACWGDCSLEEGYHYKVHAGEDLFAAVGVKDILSSEVGIHRVLADLKALQAADEAFAKAIEAAQNQEVEAAKQQAQQATESIKF